VIVSGLLIVGGCGSPPPPDVEPEPETLSYAEALQIYNQELLALDRLKNERDKLQKSLTPDATELVGGLLEQAGDARAEMNQALKDLGGVDVAADTEDGEEKEDPLKALGQQLQQAQQDRADRQTEIEARIAELEQEIAEQQKRVDRAKADKDAAEASQR
jgi:hypothetical protein